MFQGVMDQLHVTILGLLIGNMSSERSAAVLIVNLQLLDSNTRRTRSVSRTKKHWVSFIFRNLRFLTGRALGMGLCMRETGLCIAVPNVVNIGVIATKPIVCFFKIRTSVTSRDVRVAERRALVSASTIERQKKPELVKIGDRADLRPRARRMPTAIRITFVWIACV